VPQISHRFKRVSGFLIVTESISRMHCDIRAKILLSSGKAERRSSVSTAGGRPGAGAPARGSASISSSVLILSFDLETEDYKDFELASFPLTQRALATRLSAFNRKLTAFFR